MQHNDVGRLIEMRFSFCFNLIDFEFRLRLIEGLKKVLFTTLWDNH